LWCTGEDWGSCAIAERLKGFSSIVYGENILRLHYQLRQTKV
jgi:hypothetical protein